MKHMIVITAVLCLLLSGFQAVTEAPFVGSIVLSEINGQAAPSSGVSLDSLSGANLQGKVFGLNAETASTYLVQAAIHRLYDNKWWVVGSSKIMLSHDSAGKPVWRWTVQDVRFPLPDYGKGFEIVAVVVNSKHGILQTGLMDYATINRFMCATTIPVHSKIRSGNTGFSGVNGDCAIGITTITDVHGKSQEPGTSDPITLGSITRITGEVDEPNKTYRYLIVQPIAIEEKWVMPHEGVQQGRLWTETLNLSRFGLDVGKYFRIQAIVTKSPLQLKKYSLAQWSKRIEPIICARSKEALAVRVIVPSDLVITQIDQSLLSESQVTVSHECQVMGGIEEPQQETALKDGETVWILTRPLDGQGWTVQAPAHISEDGLHWHAPSVRFPTDGQYKLLAVSSSVKLVRGRILSDDAWYQSISQRTLRRLSAPVTITVKARALELTP